MWSCATSYTSRARSCRNASPGLALRRRNLLEDFAGFGEAAELLFREDERAFDHDIEHATAALDEHSFNVACALQLSRQTGGSGQIASLAAVSDLDFHCQGS